MGSRPAYFLFAVTLAAGCDATRPAQTGVVFDLLSVDGQSLPAPWRLAPEPRTVVRASIVLPVWTPSVDNATASWRITLRSPDGTETELRTNRSYFRQGAVVGFDTCPPEFDCASILLPHSHAGLTGNLLEFPSENGHQALVYLQR